MGSKNLTQPILTQKRVVGVSLRADTCSYYDTAASVTGISITAAFILLVLGVFVQETAGDLQVSVSL